MAAKQKSGAARAKAGRKKARTMNQSATAARRKTQSLGRDTETAVAIASEWADDRASMASAAMRHPQQLLTEMLSAAMAWQAIGLRVGATVTKRWLAVSGLAFYHPRGWWMDAENLRVSR